MASDELLPATVEEVSSTLFDIEEFHEKLACLSKTADNLLKDLKKAQSQKNARRKSAGADNREHTQTDQARSSSSPECYAGNSRKEYGGISNIGIQEAVQTHILTTPRHQEVNGGRVCSNLCSDDVGNRGRKYRHPRREPADQPCVSEADKRIQHSFGATRGIGQGQHYDDSHRNQRQHSASAREHLTKDDHFSHENGNVSFRYSAGSLASSIASSLKSKPALLQMKRVKHSKPRYITRPIIRPVPAARPVSRVCQCSVPLQAECGKMYHHLHECRCRKKTGTSKYDQKVVEIQKPNRGFSVQKTHWDDGYSRSFPIDSQCDAIVYSEGLSSNPSTLSCSSSISCVSYKPDNVPCVSPDRTRVCVCPLCEVNYIPKRVSSVSSRNKNLSSAIHGRASGPRIQQSNRNDCSCVKCERIRAKFGRKCGDSKRSNVYSRLHAEPPLNAKSSDPAQCFPCKINLRTSVSETSAHSARRNLTSLKSRFGKCTCCNFCSKNVAQKRYPARQYDTDEMSELCRCKTPTYSLSARSSGESQALQTMSEATLCTSGSMVASNHKRNVCCCAKKDTALSTPLKMPVVPVRQTLNVQLTKKMVPRKLTSDICVRCTCAKRCTVRQSSPRICTCIPVLAKKPQHVFSCDSETASNDPEGECGAALHSPPEKQPICDICKCQQDTNAGLQMPHPAACGCAECICPDESDAYSHQFTASGELYRPPSASSFVSQSLEKCPCPYCSMYVVREGGYHVQRGPAQPIEPRQSRRSLDSSEPSKLCHSSRSKTSRRSRRSDQSKNSSRGDKPRSMNSSSEEYVKFRKSNFIFNSTSKGETGNALSSFARKKGPEKVKQAPFAGSDSCPCSEVCPCESEVSVQTLISKSTQTDRKQDKSITQSKISSRTMSERDEKFTRSEKSDDTSKNAAKYQEIFTIEENRAQLSFRDGFMKSEENSKKIIIQRSETREVTATPFDLEFVDEVKLELDLDLKEEVYTEDEAKWTGPSAAEENLEKKSVKYMRIEEEMEVTENILPRNTSNELTASKIEEQPKEENDSPSLSKCSCSQYEGILESKRELCVCSACFRDTDTKGSWISDRCNRITESTSCEHGSKLYSNTSRPSSYDGSGSVLEVLDLHSQPLELGECADEFKDGRLVDAVLPEEPCQPVDEPKLENVFIEPDVYTQEPDFILDPGQTEIEEMYSTSNSTESEAILLLEKTDIIKKLKQEEVHPQATDVLDAVDSITLSCNCFESTFDEKDIVEKEQTRSDEGMGDQEVAKGNEAHAKENSSEKEARNYHDLSKKKKDFLAGVCPNDCGCPDCPFVTSESWLEDDHHILMKTQKTRSAKSPSSILCHQGGGSDLSCSEVLDQIREIVCGAKIAGTSVDGRCSSLVSNRSGGSNYTSTGMQKCSCPGGPNTRQRSKDTGPFELASLLSSIRATKDYSATKTVARIGDSCMENAANYRSDGSNDELLNVDTGFNSFFGFLFSEIKNIKETLNCGLQKIGGRNDCSSNISGPAPPYLEFPPSSQGEVWKSACCVPPGCIQTPCCCFSAAVSIIDVHSVGEKSLLITWKINFLRGIVGFEVYVDGCLKSRSFSPTRTSALAYGVDISRNHTINVVAMMGQMCGSVNVVPAEGSYCYTPIHA